MTPNPQDYVDVLVCQRNDALDNLVNRTAELVAARRRVSELEEELTRLRGCEE